MKGVHIGPDFLGRLLITIFIISMIFMLMVIWIPEFVNTNCLANQGEKINKIFSEALSASATTIRDFTVESCMEYIDFSELYCSFLNQGRFSDTSITRCYEMVQDGQNSGNCVDSNTYIASRGDIYAVQLYKKSNTDSDEVKFNEIDCGDHKGTIRKFPTGPNVLEVDTLHAGVNGKLKEGRYSVEIRPYRIKFLGSQLSTE
jgi:hypothetical protein